jgi:hypothetical protein
MFESAGLKVKRAEKHIADLKAASDTFIQRHPHTLRIRNDTDTGILTVEVHFREAIPTDISLISGDAIHNLRTALDHATWELIGIDGGTRGRQTAFPAGGTQGDYESTCNKIETPRGDTKKFLIALAAFPGGMGQKLYGLNRLDNADKHTVLTPVAGVASVGHLKVVYPNGQVAMTMTNTKFTMGPDGRAHLVDLRRGLSIEFDQDSNVALDIFFGDVEFFKSLPLVETLKDLHSAVSDVIGQFEKLIAARI